MRSIFTTKMYYNSSYITSGSVRTHLYKDTLLRKGDAFSELVLHLRHANKLDF